MLRHHLNKLEYFCMIVEAQSLSKASKIAYISQPQLSKVVKQLEEELSTKLLLREQDGVRLTEAGRKLYNFGKTVLSGANQVECLIRRREKIKGKVRFGTYDSISRYLFPEFVRFMDGVHPDLTLTLSTDRSHELIKRVDKGELDLALIVSEKDQIGELEVRSMYSDSFGFYMAPQINRRSQEHLIVFPEALNMQVQDFKDQFDFENLLTCDNLETVKVLAEQAMGVALLPHRVAKESLLSAKLELCQRDLPTNLAAHQIVLIQQKKQVPKHIQETAEYLENFLALWTVR